MPRRACSFLLPAAASCHCHCCGHHWEPPTTLSMDGRWLERDGAQALTKNGLQRRLSILQSPECAACISLAWPQSSQTSLWMPFWHPSSTHQLCVQGRTWSCSCVCFEEEGGLAGIPEARGNCPARLNLARLVTCWGLFLCRGEQGMQLAVSASVGCLVWVFSPHQQSEDIQGCQRCQGVSDTPKDHPGAGLRTHRPLVWPLPSYASGVPAPQSQPLHLMRGLAQSGELPSQPPHCLPNGP